MNQPKIETFTSTFLTTWKIIKTDTWLQVINIRSTFNIWVIQFQPSRWNPESFHDYRATQLLVCRLSFINCAQHVREMKARHSEIDHLWKTCELDLTPMQLSNANDEQRTSNWVALLSQSFMKFNILGHLGWALWRHRPQRDFVNLTSTP